MRDGGGDRWRGETDRGATAVEYALLTVLIAIVAAGGAEAFGAVMSARITSQTGQVSVAVTPTP